MTVPDKLRIGFVLALFAFGLATLGTESTRWLGLTVAAYSAPALAQIIPLLWIKALGVWFGIFLLVQTLVSPMVPGIRYQSFPPNFESTFNVRSGLPGISGVQSITTDELGFRVTHDVDYTDGTPYRIFAIGGSTTADEKLDDAKT